MVMSYQAPGSISPSHLELSNARATDPGHRPGFGEAAIGPTVPFSTSTGLHEDRDRRRQRLRTSRRSPPGSAPRGILDAGLTGGDERHHGPQLLADLLDLMRFPRLAQCLEFLAPRRILGDPLVGKGAALDLIEDPLHFVPDRLIDD